MKQYYDSLFCKCGCGEKIEIKKYHSIKGSKIPKYIRGHWIKCNINPMKRPEVVKKMSGKNHPMKRPEVIKKFIGENNGFYGKSHSDDQKKKWSIERTGSKRTKKSRIKQSISIGGENNWNWKGGISCEPYCDSWSDKEFKESIKERDGYLCLNPSCNEITNTLCVHHIDYIKKNCHPLNLITLCISCNAKANFNREWHQAWYKIIIYKRYNKGVSL